VGAASGRDAGLHAAARAARENGLPEARFLRGGFWRNYMARYREINELHKQMLRASGKVEAMPAAGPGADGPTRKTRAVDHLYQASPTTVTGMDSSAASTSRTCAWPR